MKYNRIMLAFDSFKGSLTSAEVAECVEETIMGIDPMITVDRCLISDGGEGLLEAMQSIIPLERIEVEVMDPLGRLHKAQFGWDSQQQLAVIESAQACGLVLVESQHRNPLKTTAYGVGQIIIEAIHRGAKSVLLGLGGSATNEGGLSILQALGAKITNRNGYQLSPITGENLQDVTEIDLSTINPRIRSTHFILACDVNNPFTGPNGASYIYGPQKGAKDAALKCLEHGMENIRQIILTDTGIDLNEIAGAGAAGGIAGSLLAYLKTELKPGIEIILEAQHFDSKVKKADFVITGEGKSDRQTLMGKAPLGVLRLAKKQGVPTVLMSGLIEDRESLLEAGFTKVIATKPDEEPLSDAMKPGFAKRNLREATKQMLRAK